VGVDGDRRRFQRTQAIVIVQRMELRQMQDRRQRRTLVEAHASGADDIFIGFRPAVGTRHHAHAVRSQSVKLAHVGRAVTL
jgi:hypothetical protein